MKKILSLILAAGCIVGLSAQSGEKFSGWKKAETEHFTFIYEDSSRETTEAYAEIADDAWNKIANIYSIPRNHFNIYVTDRTNTVNAFTYFAPTEIGMFTTPPTINDFGFRAPWKTLFFTHELIHAANVTFEEKSNLVENLTGPFIKNLDLMGVPGWALEGLTTTLETELTAGGRGRSPYFELQYKAPTLENSLISYKQIGLEQEPPRGQAYVLGYVIMRSIADRWGIQALADIERNRPLLGSWEDSVKLVTGYTPEEIYRDAKIALVKKYAQEREISEGITISPRDVNTNYYKPAYIYEDGSLITLRNNKNGSAVVRLNPALRNGSAYIELTAPEKDLNSVFSETILFEGSFPESHCITADENGTVYAAMATATYHKQPGSTLEHSIYKWTEAEGLKKLTKNATYIQPSVSRDGKTLVALRQFGLTFDLVKIDVETGVETILLKDATQDLIQPSVNDDGSKVAFMAVDGKRAKICVLSINNPENFEVIYNGEGEITDPSYPHWVEGKLVITDNQRGRLEAFEFSEENGFVPVVSDPCGVLWAAKTDKGVYYSTFSATGFVLKIKPEAEWGNVPDFYGPSMPGEIVTFGALESDYPDFNPYEKLCEIEVPEKTPEELKAEAKNRNKDEPIPVRGKVVKHRKEETIAQLKNLPEPKTELSEEKMFIPFPTPLLYIPIVVPVTDSQNTYWGFGAALVCLTPKLQMSYGAAFAGITYFPEFNNFGFDFDYYSPIGAGLLQVFTSRAVNETYGDDDSIIFKEYNFLDVGYKHPLYDVSDGRKNLTINLFVDSKISATIFDPLAFAAFSRNDYSYGLNGILGLEISSANKKAYKIHSYAADAYGLGFYDFNLNQLFAGFESEFSYNFKNANSETGYDANLKLRYTDFPSETNVIGSLVKFHGKDLDCTYPGRGVLQLGTSMSNFLGTGLDARLYGEGLCSFGNNSVDSKTPSNGNWMNFAFNDQLAYGLEFGFVSNVLTLVCGYNVMGNLFSEDILFNGNFYFTFKYDWFRY